MLWEKRWILTSLNEEASFYRWNDTPNTTEKKICLPCWWRHIFISDFDEIIYIRCEADAPGPVPKIFNARRLYHSYFVGRGGPGRKQRKHVLAAAFVISKISATFFKTPCWSSGLHAYFLNTSWWVLIPSPALHATFFFVFACSS